MPPPFKKEEPKPAVLSSIDDILSKYYLDNPSPSKKGAKDRRSVRLPLGASETDKNLLEIERKAAQEKQDKLDKELGIDRVKDEAGEQRYQRRLSAREPYSPDREPVDLEGKSLKDSRRELRLQRTSPKSADKGALMEAIRSGEISLPSHPSDPVDRGLGYAMSGSKLIGDIATGDIVLEPALEAAGLDAETVEKAGRETRGGIGAGAGFVKGMQAGKYLPSWGKIAAPLFGALGGRVMADLTSSGYELDDSGLPYAKQPTTASEAVDTVSTAAGTKSVLNTLKNAPALLRIAAGGTEAGALNEATLQAHSLIKEGKPLPSDLNSFFDRNKEALGLGGIVGKIAGSAKPVERMMRFDKAKVEVLDSLKEKLVKAQAMSRSNRTKGKRNAAKRLVEQLKKDIQNIENNPKILINNSDPKMMQRTLTILRGKRELEDAVKSNPKLDQRKAIEDQVLYLNSLQTGQAEDMALILSKAAREAPSGKIITEGQSIEKLGDGFLGTNIQKYISDPIFQWAKNRTDPLSKGIKKTYVAASNLNMPMLNRLYMGTADILERGAQKSGAGEDGVLFQLAKGLRKSVDDGNYLSADYLIRFTRKAEGMGYGGYRNRNASKKANEEFSEFMKLRHSPYGGIRGESGQSINTIRDQIGRSKGLTELKGGQPSFLHEGLVEESLRVDRAKKYYDKMSPMGKALVDGWNDASSRAGNKMSSLGVLVKDKNGKVRLAKKHSSYWPRRLKQEFEELIDNDFKNYDKLGEESPEVKKILKVFNAKDKAELKEKLGGYIGFKQSLKEVSDDPASFYNHLERAREMPDMPADALDFSVDMGASYLDNSARSLAQIEHFGGQSFTKGGGANPNFLFNIADEIGDEYTKEYIKNLKGAIFSPNSDRVWTAINKTTTGALIANPLTALKNLTGSFKTWTITGTSPMAESTLKQLGKTINEIGSKIKGVKGDPQLAERIGATGGDIGRITALVDNQSLGGATRTRGDNVIGAALRVTGFSGAEDFLRKQGTIAADLARREWMDIFDASPNANKIVETVNKLHASPKDKALLKELKSLIEESGDANVIKNNANLASAARFAARQNIDLSKVASERFSNILGKKTAVPLDPDSQPETRRLLQSWTKETQGGYKIDQLPLFMQNDKWKTVFKFQNWGMQMQRHLHKNIIGEAENGNYKPLLKWFAATQLAGESVGQFLEAYGRDREDASYGEIAKAFETDEGKGLLMIVNRMINNAALGGQWDLLAGYIGGNALRYQKTGSLDTLTVPAAQVIDNTIQTASSLMETGLSERTKTDASRTISALNRGRQLYREATGYKPQEYDTAKRKLNRFVKERFLKESQYALRESLNLEKPQLKGKFSPTLSAVMKADIISKIQSGETEEANRIADEFVKKQIEDRTYFRKGDEKLIRDALGYTIKRARPLKVGNSTSEEAIGALKAFMKESNYDDEENIIRLDDDYMNSAYKSGLLEEPAEETSVQKALRESSKGKYNTVKAKAEARKFVKDNESLMGQRDRGASALAVKALDMFEIKEPSSKLSKRENAERRRYYESVIKEVKRISDIKDKEKRMLEYLLPDDFKSISNSWVKAEYLDNHFDAVGVPKGYNERRKVIDNMVSSGAISRPDGQAFEEYIRTE